MTCVRELFYERERQTLSPYAFLCENTRGREVPVPPCPNRTEFQRDRDRILHCKSFRRLMHKTQVFLLPTDEHYRTRLTHTLEVAQIARIIARAMLLNEDLCEAAALGHDLGHTPFGHCGEEVMRALYAPDFTHYRQSLRVVEVLENNGSGLNLTWEVRDAIVNHTGDHMSSTREGVIVKYADRIAYINHDIDDACRAGILSEADIPTSIRTALGATHSERINRMVTSVIEHGAEEIGMTPEIQEATMALRQFLFERVYYNPEAKKEECKVKALLTSLFDYFCKYPNKMPVLYRSRIAQDGMERCVCDYISGMTDRYAIDLYESLFIPKVWSGMGEES